MLYIGNNLGPDFGGLPNIPSNEKGGRAPGAPPLGSAHGNKPTMLTQHCIPPGSLNQVPVSAGVRAGMLPLSDGRYLIWRMSSRSGVET